MQKINIDENAVHMTSIHQVKFLLNFPDYHNLCYSKKEVETRNARNRKTHIKHFTKS